MSTKPIPRNEIETMTIREIFEGTRDRVANAEPDLNKRRKPRKTTTTEETTEDE